ncbi:MAG TPA: iron-sulfur cluster assembly scaffold protein [Steroidobacteraceae bacterium]|nr:iron-sulfur cluster assembly scaffold protein [Steroidobacteraceae bacterium]
MTDDDRRYGIEVRLRMATLSGAGSLPAGSDVVTACAGDREQGAEVRLQFRVGNGRVVDARFQAFGCPHFLAAASWLTDRLRDADRAQLEAWDWREAATALEVPAAKYGRLLTLQDAVRAAARNWPGATRSTV